MVAKQESYTKQELEASGRGELFGEDGPPLPSGNMLMMDRVIKMAGILIKAISKLSWISNLSCGFSVAISSMIRSCRAVWAWMPCGS